MFGLNVQAHGSRTAGRLLHLPHSMDELISKLNKLGAHHECIRTATSWEEVTRAVGHKVNLNEMYRRHGFMLVRSLRKQGKLKGLLKELYPELTSRFDTKMKPDMRAWPDPPKSHSQAPGWHDGKSASVSAAPGLHVQPNVSAGSASSAEVLVSSTTHKEASTWWCPNHPTTYSNMIHKTIDPKTAPDLASCSGEGTYDMSRGYDPTYASWLASESPRGHSLARPKKAGSPEPSFRLFSESDFLHVAAGVKNCVDVLDDADTDQIPMKKIKAFPEIEELRKVWDVSQLESVSEPTWSSLA